MAPPNSVEQFCLQFGIAALADGDAGRQVLHHRQRLDGLPGITERGTADQIRLDTGLPLTIVANDIGGAFAEAYVGEGDERHAASALRRDAYLFENLPVGARVFLEQDADGDGPIAGIEFCKRRADIADGRHPDRFRQALGRYTQAHRQVAARVNSQLRAIERRAGHDIRHDREPPHLGGQFGSDIRYRRVVLAGDDELDVSLSVVVDEPIADVRNVGEVAADRLFELLLRERSLRFRHVVDGQRRPGRRRRRRSEFVRRRRRRSPPPGRFRMRLTMISVTASVSESCEPGGSSMPSIERAVSVTGRKPLGSRRCPGQGCSEEKQAEGHGDEAISHRPGDEPGVKAQDASIALLFVLMRLQEIGREHRRYQSRAEQRKQHLDRDCYAELLEELARDRGHEARGR